MTGKSSVQVPAFVCVLCASPELASDSGTVGLFEQSCPVGGRDFIAETLESSCLLMLSLDADRQRPAVIRTPWHPAVRAEEASPGARV